MKGRHILFFGHIYDVINCAKLNELEFDLEEIKLNF